MKLTEETRSALSVEIFDATGLAVDKDDPVVICALMQSHYMQQAQKQVTRQIEQSAAKAIQSIEAAIASHADLLARQTSSQIFAALQSATALETSKIKANLNKFAEGLKAKLAIEPAYMEAGNEPSKRSVLGMAATLVVMTVCGAIVGARAYGQPDLTPKQIRELQYGRMLVDTLPHLDKGTKAKLFAAMEKTIPKNKK